MDLHTCQQEPDHSVVECDRQYNHSVNGGQALGGHNQYLWLDKSNQFPLVLPGPFIGWFKRQAAWISLLSSSIGSAKEWLSAGIPRHGVSHYGIQLRHALLYGLQATAATQSLKAQWLHGKEVFHNNGQIFRQAVVQKLGILRKRLQSTFMLDQDRLRGTSNVILQCFNAASTNWFQSHDTYVWHHSVTSRTDVSTADQCCLLPR